MLKKIIALVAFSFLSVPGTANSQNPDAQSMTAAKRTVGISFSYEQCDFLPEADHVFLITKTPEGTLTALKSKEARQIIREKFSTTILFEQKEAHNSFVAQIIFDDETGAMSNVKIYGHKQKISPEIVPFLVNLIAKKSRLGKIIGTTAGVAATALTLTWARRPGHSSNLPVQSPILTPEFPNDAVIA